MSSSAKIEQICNSVSHRRVGRLCEHSTEALGVHGLDISGCGSSLSQELRHHNTGARPIQNPPAAMPGCNVGSLDARNLPNGGGTIV